MGTDTVALPDQKLPFMVVFTDLPKNLDEFTVEAINSVQIDIRGTKAAWQKLVKINSQARAPNGELVKDLLEKLQERN